MDLFLNIATYKDTVTEFQYNWTFRMNFGMYYETENFNLQGHNSLTPI